MRSGHRNRTVTGCYWTRNAFLVRLKYTCFYLLFSENCLWSDLQDFLMRPYAVLSLRVTLACFASLVVCILQFVKKGNPHSLIIPQYSVGSSAVIKAKRDGSLFKFFVEQLGNPSHTSKYRKSPVRPFFSRSFSLEVLYSSKTTVLCCRILTSWSNMALNIVSTARSDLCFTSILEAILNQEFNKSGKIQLCQVPARYEIRQYLTFLSLWRSFGAAKAGGIQSFKLDQVCWCRYCKMVVYSLIAVWVKSWGYKEGCWVCLEVPGRRCQISW